MTPDQPRSTEPRSAEPRSTEPRSAEPRSTEPRSAEPRSTEPRSAEPRVAAGAATSATDPFARSGPADRPAPPPRHRPKLRADVVAVVFAGGCIGGYARYAVTDAWPAPAGRFPASTFAVNTAGAFVLALLIAVLAELGPSRYLRPLVGTGFCGALTTFSSVVVVADQLVAHDHAGTGVAYVVASIVAGLTAAALGLAVGRSAVAGRRSVERRQR